MAFVSGDAGSARDLAEFLKKTMDAIVQECEKIDKSCNNLAGSWRDEGVADAQEAVKTITSGVKNCADDYHSIYSKLHAYADFLES